MSFLAPAAAILAVLLPIIVLMYLLKLRRVEHPVSSVYLWRRMVRDFEANAPWQRLRHNWLLWLQLVFLAVLILALMRPYTWASGVGGQAAILILDRSASMAATDVSPSRLEAAKAQAHRLVDDLPSDARATVIAAGEGAQVLLSSSRDRRAAHEAIQAVTAGTGGSDLTAALELASAIAARQPDTEIVVLSDGRVTLSDRLAIKGHVRFAPLGISGDNQAIALFSLQRMPGGGGLSAFAQVANYGDETVERRLALYGDGQLIAAYDLQIAAHGTQAVVADDLAPDFEVIEARLGGQDLLALDDHAWAVQEGGEPAAVTLVSEGNLFLETALALFPSLEVTVVRPGEWEDQAGASPAGQEASEVATKLTILDAYVPLTATLPSGSLFFIAPPRSTDYFTVTGKIQGPIPQAADPSDPLLAHVSLETTSVLEAAQIVPRSWGRTVVAGKVDEQEVPLLLAGQVDGRRMAVLAFDLHHSDLPLQIAFPLLLSHLVDWLAPGTGGMLPAQIAPGTAVPLALPPGVTTLSAVRPDGSSVRLEAERGQMVLADTEQLGVYRLQWGDERASLAVNLFSPQESDIRPAEVLPLAGTEAELGARPDAGGPLRARQEWWRPLAYVALALLVMEWIYYQRSVVARLIGWLRSEDR